MAFKRNIDRFPIPPNDANVYNVVCHFCIVGCGYHAISWPVDRQGGTRPNENIFGVDLAQHAERVIRLGRDAKIPDKDIVSVIASSVLMDAYPPSMHGKSFCGGRKPTDTPCSFRTWSAVSHPVPLLLLVCLLPRTRICFCSRKSL